MNTLTFFKRFLNKAHSFLSNSKYITHHAFILVFLSGLMVYVSTEFSINELFDHPQFSTWSEFEAFVASIEKNGKELWFRSFFIIDAFWAFTLLTFLYRLIWWSKNRLGKDIKKPASWDPFTIFVIAVFSIAYLLDLIEGVNYLVYALRPLEAWVVEFKTYAYFGSFILFGVHLYLDWSRRLICQEGQLTNIECTDEHGFTNKLRSYYSKSLRVFFSTSYLSLIVVLVLILIAGLPQGYTMVVDLIAKPISLVLTFIVLFVLAVVVSHYPAYVEAGKFIKSGQSNHFINWHKRTLFGLFGIVYYTKPDDEQDNQDECIGKYRWVNGYKSIRFSKVSKVLRYHLGSAMFVSFLYLLGYAGSEIFEGFLFSKQWAWLILLLGFYFHYLFLKQTIQVRKKVFYILLSLSLASISLTTVLSVIKDYGWSKSTLWLTIISTILLMLTYIAFRLCRRQLMNDYSDGNRKSTRKLTHLITVFSTLSLLFLIFINVFFGFTEQYMSSILLVLLYALNFYGIAIVTTKFSLFYEYSNTRNWFLRYAVPLIIPIIFIYSFAESSLSDFTGNKSDNPLHYLRKVPESQNTIDLDKFISDFKTRDTIDQIKPIMFTSHGGGLMADYWVLLVLQQLQDDTNGRFLAHTFNMSANSGGAIGIANYANLAYNHKTQDRMGRYSAIDEVGDFNHLSWDIASLFGRDLVRMFVPSSMKVFGDLDRSQVAMNEYARRTGDSEGDVQNLSYRDHWSNIYRLYDGVFPSLTVSSTVVKNGGFANAFSLKLSRDEHQSIFRGIENALDINKDDNDSSLTFFGAASLSNRFPGLSPAAAIKGKGQFIDGGAYDNTGILNALELSNYMVKKDSTFIPQFVVLTNDTYQYIDYLFHSLKWTNLKEENYGELAAILRAGIKIDRYGEHLDASIPDASYTRIVLPRIISYQDILNYLGGEPLNQDLIPNDSISQALPIPKRLLPYLAERVKQENELIIKTLNEYDGANYAEWGAVQTPLARLLSKPAMEYQKAMLEHPIVKEQIQSIVDQFNGPYTNYGNDE